MNTTILYLFFFIIAVLACTPLAKNIGALLKKNEDMDALRRNSR